MMRGRRNLLWLAPLILLLGWPIYGGLVRGFLTPPGGGPETEISRGKAAEEAEGQRFVMDEVRFVQALDGVREWRIDSKRMRSGKSESELLLDGVKALLFRKERQHMNITANQGLYDTELEILTLSEAVRVVTADGYRITSPSLQYHEKESKVTSQSGVEIIGKDLEIRSINLDYNLKSGQYLLTGKVAATTW